MKLTHNEIKALSRVINIAHNLGQSHEQRIEIIEAIHEADKVINKLWEDLEFEDDDVIRVGDKVIHEDEEYFVCSIDKTVDNYPYNLSVFKEDIGKSFYELRNKRKGTEWNIAHINEITKVKSKWSIKKA